MTSTPAQANPPQQELAPSQPVRGRSRAGGIVLAIASLAVMLLFLEAPPVQRTQEARVLQTAREMLHAGDWRGWMIPNLNGHMRLEKPPLAYWLAAGAYAVGGVSDAVGRVPFAVAGWLTMLLTFAAGRRLFSREAGLYAAAALPGFLMFARHARLAETDILATLFITAAVVCMLRRTIGSLALSGAMIGLAVVAKGPPAAFAVVFLLALCAIDRDWKLAIRWLLSGAPLIAAAIGAPWYIYIIRTIGYATFKYELQISVEGAEHQALALQYLPDLLRATLPWVALVILAIVAAVRLWKAERGTRVVIGWCLAILVPLCFAGQRQYHYLLPAMPPVALLAGWLVADAFHGRRELLPIVRPLILWTLHAFALAAIAMPFIGRHVRGNFVPADFILAAVAIVGWLACVLEFPRRATTAARFAAVMALAMALLVQVWLPSLRPANPRALAREIRARCGDGPYFFFGPNISVPLLFYMPAVMPHVQDADQLARVTSGHASIVLVAQTKAGREPPPVPPGFERVAELRSEDQLFEIYRTAR
jgi:4-amino-4-deoxy-L-arabinose transferase-like glycosyltransferase